MAAHRQRQRKGDPVTGWLNLHKPYEMTSTQAVAYIKRLFRAQKVGHGGTLDPLATGVLPIALGEATKTMQFILESDKKYRFTVTFGEERNTDDAEGEITQTSTSQLTQDALEDCLPHFLGAIEQLPPQFSAIKQEGQTAYARARKGETVDMPPRPVTIHSFSLVDITGTPEAVSTATFDAHVSKGTYVRSLARDMGRMLGCYGYISQLVRTQAGPFKLEAAVTKETLDKFDETGQKPLEHLQGAAAGLDDIPAYVAEPAEVRQFRQGKAIQRVHLQPGLRKVVTRQGDLISLVEVQPDGNLRIVRNFN